MSKEREKIQVNAEGGELIIRNNYNDIAIIPKEDADMIRNLIMNGCYSCVDSYISSLPVYNPSMHKAGAGFVYPSNYEVYLKRKTKRR